ncbi:unnamed protein product [Clonostachys rhizophaga]|uniref:Kelch repeat-containing protein n=1 Tax=Clonostachys rhizophaga TaxID=160324 RepID=A0A9N9YFN2_9HYPO|nr:unnamed protein product [Clonostachys rhizophaga]
MSLATASPVPASPVVTVVPPQPVRERGMRPRLLSIPTSERLSDAATIEPLIKMISGKIRKGRRSVFKEVGLDDDADRDDENHSGDLLRPSCSQKNGKTPEEAERKFGELSNIHPRHHNTAPQPPTAASDLSPSSQDSRPRQRQNSLPNQPWYTRLTRPKGRPRVRSVSGTPPATISGFHQFTLAAMLLTLFLPSCHIHGTRPGLEVMVTDASVLSKRALSPVDVCLRWAHQAANVNGTLYIYGGEAREEEDQHENTWNNNFLTLDLSSDWSVDSPALVGLEKPNGPPAVALGYLWQDYNNLYLYGGQFSDSPYTEPAPESIWRYSISSKSWTEFSNPKTSEGNYSDSAGEPVHRASEGAGASVPELGLSFYFGGHLDWATTPGWSRDIERVYLKSLLEFTHPGYANSGVNALRGKGAGQSGAFRNITSTPVQQNNFPERADGVLVYVPGWGELGVLIGLAGGTAEDFTYDLRRLDVYDIASSQWFHQETSGEIPSVRVNPCATVASAPDASSFQIYLFGGQNLQPYGNQTQYNDMFILTIPSFTWIKVEPSNNTPGPRAGHTCTMWNGQIVVVGGYIGNDYKCDSPGIHVFDASKLKWKDTFAAGDHPPDFHADNMVLAASNGYSVPDPVQKVIGGSEQGGATVTTPASGPATDGPFATGKPPVFTVTQSGGITTVTPTSGPGSGQDEPEVSPGLVATGVIAGIAGVLAFYLGFCAWLYRRQVSVYKQHLTDAKRYSSDRVVASGTQDGPYQASGAAQNDENIRESKNASAWEDFSTGPAWLSEPKWASSSSDPTRETSSGSGIGEQYHGGIMGRRSSESGESTEGLLDGREPSFFSVVMAPRRALRVVNGADS